jgi:acetoacetate decarboxylase
MLKGYTVPRTPLGTAALTPPPPWHFAGDVLAVEFWNDPDVAADCLPCGIALDASRAGRSVALFVDSQFTAQDNEHLDPARYQCREFIVLLDAMWQGTEIAWCPYAYADNDAALVRGWIQGYPQKIGVVHQTRTFAAAGAASAPLVKGGRLAASVCAHGQLLAQARITLREKADHLVGLLDRAILARRHFPRLCAGLHDKPAVDEIVRCKMDDVLTTNIWIGDGDLVFPETHGEELEMLGPIKVGRGFRFSFSGSVSDSETLVDLTSDGHR